ncbi:MAG: type I-E CRISPR-associated protein Cse2/CasB [Methanofollis sp.]|uniref:type I-E CRISPR-associated protein Cse2/CasB n=1 Tax=Methanofollis sp. TaxID=2052835 RepID=UPI00262EADB7|nr:type I-E CRISPR-associated protein Cse2/CasB [Methanofollis sp.]MDD4255673.1 type I-E CRISPR-associated protein Cse2/CasB [Methanofollis sp.]
MNSTRYLSFSKSPEEREVLGAWWKELQDNHGDRAALRRCTSAAEVAFVPAFHHLRLELSKITSVRPESLARVAGVLSHVKTYDETGGRRIAQQIAAKREGSDQGRVSDLRFRRLLAIDDKDQLYGSMIRILRLLKGEADIPSLADGIYWWNDGTKNAWAYDYYSVALEKK